MFRKIILLAIVIINIAFLPHIYAATEDLDRELKDIILARGFGYEEHQVLTKDGYILTLERIPGTLKD
jgi:hypothetical protein